MLGLCGDEKGGQRQDDFDRGPDQIGRVGEGGGGEEDFGGPAEGGVLKDKRQAKGTQDKEKREDDNPRLVVPRELRLIH